MDDLKKTLEQFVKVAPDAWDPQPGDLIVGVVHSRYAESGHAGPAGSLTISDQRTAGNRRHPVVAYLGDLVLLQRRDLQSGDSGITESEELDLFENSTCSTLSSSHCVQRR